MVWMCACCTPAVSGANHGSEGLLSHAVLFMVKISSDYVSSRDVCLHAQSRSPPSPGLTHRRGRRVAAIKHIMKIKGNGRWKPIKFQSRALLWVGGSLVPQNAAHVQPATTPAASKGMSPFLPEIRRRTQIKCHRDPGSFSPLFAIWWLRCIREEKA